MRLVYRISTFLTAGMMLLSGVSYFIVTDEIAWTFHDLGFPAFLVLPLGVAKFLGALALVQQRFTTLRQWAYAGFCFDYLLALLAHIHAADNLFVLPIAALSLLLLSYWSGFRLGVNPSHLFSENEQSGTQ